MQSPTGSQIASSLLRLRQDAIERGHGELAITYGWSVIRMGAEEIERRAAQWFMQNSHKELDEKIIRYLESGK